MRTGLRSPSAPEIQRRSTRVLHQDATRFAPKAMYHLGALRLVYATTPADMRAGLNVLYRWRSAPKHLASASISLHYLDALRLVHVTTLAGMRVCLIALGYGGEAHTWLTKAWSNPEPKTCQKDASLGFESRRQGITWRSHSASHLLRRAFSSFPLSVNRARRWGSTSELGR